ncbi:MAG TPA: GH25 family lysozyme [Gaiellaceae bacterium]|nr:GH25 family lysozyme [Gaiellaceae bacterium]
MGVGIAARRGLIALLAALAASLVAVAPADAATRAKGIDVSHWNGAIDWIRVAGAGYRFVFGKATEGFSLVDPTYSVNRAGTEGFGLRFGAYHFARPSGGSDAAATASAIAQADHFVDVADPQRGELPPVLDLEAKGGLTPKRLQTWTRAWLDEVYARTGVKPMIYSSPNFWKTAVGDSSAFAAAGNRLWVAHWTKKASPLVPGGNWGGQGWTFWQWTNCSVVPGFAHCSDGDRMSGPDPGVVALKAYPTGVPAVSTAPSVLGITQAGKVLAAVPGVWSGGKPVRFSYQWQRCDAAGANCQPIAGAIAEKYTANADDVGHSLVVAVTAQSAAGLAAASSGPTAAIAAAGTKPTARPAPIAPPQLAGTPQAGQTLTAEVGTWSGSPTGFAYQWRRCDAAGLNCVAIAGATLGAYVVTPGDIGATLGALVTATGAGGAASVSTPLSAAVAAAPLPAPSSGSAVAVPGQAGYVVDVDGRASVTWQPGAVPNGLTTILAPFEGTLSLAGTGVAIGVPGLPAGGFPWPVDIGYTTPPQPDTVLGYSTDAKLYAPVDPLASPSLPAASTIGSYLAGDGTMHVLTRVPVRLAWFREGAWGDPKLSSVLGPSLLQHTKVKLLRRKDRTVLVLTRLSSKSQANLFAQVRGKGKVRLAVLPRGSRLGTWLKPGRASKTVRTQIAKPGGIAIRLRLNARFLRHGTTYRIRVVATDPFGRVDQLVLPFRYP